MTFESVGPDRVVAWIELGQDQHTPWGVVHGGAYTTAIESAASVGASAAVLDRGQFAVGVNNITDFLRPLRRGRVKVVAEPIHQGTTQQLWQVIISKADDGKVLARGQVRLQNVSLDR
jgi:uncharacterized protein (TIGR00369 family)